MAFEPFGLVGGLSVGIPPILVINDNGVATLNGLQVTGTSNLGSIGNVIILGGVDGYFLQTDGAGGLTWAPTGNSGNGNGVPGGSNSEVQFNNAGNFGGDAGFTYDRVSNILTVTGNIVSYEYNSSGNVTSNNFVGSNLTVANVNATTIVSTGNLSVSNANLGNLASANFYTGNGSLLTGIVSTSSNFANYAGNVTVSNQPNITSVGTLTTLSVSGNANVGNLGLNGLFSTTVTATGNANVGNIRANLGLFTTVTGTLSTNAQPNITSVGTLNGLTATGNVSLGYINNVHITGGLLGQVLTTNGNGTLTWQNAPSAYTATYVTANYQPNITSTGTLTVLNVNGISTLGNVGNIKISGGSNGYTLITDGNSNLSWIAPANGGGIGGSNTQIQFNDNGEFGGTSAFTFDETSNTVNVSGNLIANTLTLGSGVYAFSRSNVFFAITSSNATQELYSVEADTIAGADFTIIATDATANTRQVSKISSIFLGEAYQYNEYSTLAVNGATGYYSMAYLPGNISVTSQFVLYVTPTTNNNIVHKISIQSYDI